MKLRVSAVQYHLHTINSFKEFAQQVEHYIKTAEEFGSDFVLFPEFFTTQLMSIGNTQGKPLTIGNLPDFTERYCLLFKNLAIQTKMHIIGGTHVIRKGEQLYNCADILSRRKNISTTKASYLSNRSKGLEANSW
jgi:predicted amidohydrolase